MKNFRTQFCPSQSQFIRVLLLITFATLSVIHTSLAQTTLPSLSNVCLGQNKQWTFTMPSGTNYLERNYVGENNWNTPIGFYTSGTVNLNHTFDGVPGYVTIYYCASWNNLVNKQYFIQTIYETLPNPGLVNNGLVEFCGNNQTVSALSSPYISECNFHFNFIWEVPNNISINEWYSLSQNPVNPQYLKSVTSQVSLMGGGTGNLGNLKLTAAFAGAPGFATINPQYNPYIYIPLWGGIPNMSNFYANGQPNNGSLIFVNNGAQLQVQNKGGTRNFTWTVTSGTCSLYPYGSQCDVYPTGFAIVKVQSNNNCGNGNSFFYYLQKQSSSGFRIASNPTTQKKMTLVFEAEELLEMFVYDINIFDKNGKNIFKKSKGEIKNLKNGKNVDLDLKELKEGEYFLNVTIGDNTFKEQIIIN